MPDPHITVNPASGVTAAQWVAMIKRSPYVPREVKQSLTAKGNTIVGPAKIKTPAGIDPKWRDDFAAAFASRDWEITTAQENFAPIKDGTEFLAHRTFVFDLQSGEVGPGHWMKVDTNQREWSSYSTGEKAKPGKSEFLFGWTFSSEGVNNRARKAGRISGLGEEVRLDSKRALIIIVNRMAVLGVPPRDQLIAARFPASSQFLPSRMFPAFSQFFVTSRQFTMTEDVLVMTFLHEVGAHAGLMSQGKGADHGNAAVEDNVKAIEGQFPEDATLKIKSEVHSALAEAEGRLRDLTLGASTRGRPPGPQR